MELLAKYASVVLISMVKLIGGPVTALGLGLSAVESSLLSALGMTATAFVIAYAGDKVRQPIASFLKRKFPARFDRPMPERVQRIFDRWGMAGIAFVTPLFLSPPGGAVAGVVFQVERPKLVSAMAVAALTWSAFYTFIIYTFADWLAAHGLIELATQAS